MGKSVKDTTNKPPGPLTQAEKDAKAKEKKEAEAAKKAAAQAKHPTQGER